MVCRGKACDECVKRCERYHKKQGKFTPVESRFFKVMIGEGYHNVMYLPPMFAKKVNHLTDKVTQIENVKGDLWSVKLSRVKGSLAFQEGWQAFSQYHRLKEGYFLIFSYIKEGHFIANVFTRSGCERVDFNSEMPLGKRSRRDHRPTSENEPYKTADACSGGNRTISATSLASGDKSQGLQTNIDPTNAYFGVSLHPHIPVKFEDPICMTTRDDGYYEERINLDLSSFEMENRSSASKKSRKALLLDPSHYFNLENASDTKVSSLSCAGTVELDKPAGHDAINQTQTLVEDANISAGQTNLITGNFSDNPIGKFEKGVNANRSLSRTKITDQTRKKVDYTQMAPHSSQAGGHFREASMRKFCKKPSHNSIVKNPMSDYVCKSLDGHVIKKEPVEMKEKSNIFGGVSCIGKGTPVVWNQSQVISPRVKVEPDMSHDTGPLDTISTIHPFSAEVKSLVYLELPANLAPSRRKRNRIEGMIIYLRDSVGRVWPVAYSEYYGGRALTVNWTKFCKRNNIKPGDKCRFVVEDATRHIYRVGC